MILSRAPLRITLGGGGTDLPSYYRKFGGQLITGAIDRYIHIAIHRVFYDEYIIKYSKYERVKSREDVKHPIIREALKMQDIKPEVEIVSLADIPDGTGLGSSGAFTVSLLKALSVHSRQHLLTEELAAKACEIEINRLGQPIGKQDQYAAAYGGITCFTFNKDDSVIVEPLKISSETLHKLEDNLLLFFTGHSRSASAVLEQQKTLSEANDAEMLKNLHLTKKLGLSSKKALENGNLEEFAELMHHHWENKRKRSQDISKNEINKLYDKAREHGALGGKLIGAGGGGFLMFYTNKHAALRQAMSAENLREVRFQFDFEGAKTLTV